MVWWPAAEWERMRRGLGCPMCADGHLSRNPHSDLVSELPWSYARLSANQTHAGYCVVVFKRHACELNELTAAELSGFWADVAAVAAAVTTVFKPVKLDYLVMGHRCPHLHCHVYPQHDDSDPYGSVDISAGHVRLRREETSERIAELREALALARA